MSKIIQLLPTTSKLMIEFPKVSEDAFNAFSVQVEFMALVDYDGLREIEYGALMDGQMMLFNVDGCQVVLRKETKIADYNYPQKNTFADEYNKAMKKQKVNGGYQ
jgi:hypothetical protein